MEQLIVNAERPSVGALRVLHVAISPMTFVAMRGQLAYIRAHGFEPSVAAAPDRLLDELAAREEVATLPFRVGREPAFADIGAVRALTGLIAAARPAIVHAHTPKGGLLGMIAAHRARVPVRIYHVHGVADSSVPPARRAAWLAADMLSCRLATRVLAVGPFVRERLIASGIPRDKVTILANGSANGIDLRRFSPEVVRELREPVRSELGLPADSVVIGFVGRLGRDKGIAPLVHAFRAIRRQRPNAWLLVVGAEEPHDPLDPTVAAELRGGERIRWVGWRDDTPRLYAAMDFLTLLSRREGLPTVVLEAGAMQIPALVSRAPGCLDAVVDGTTALVVDPGDRAGVLSRLLELVDDAELRAQLGRGAYRHVRARFPQDAVWAALARTYRAELSLAQVGTDA